MRTDLGDHDLPEGIELTSVDGDDPLLKGLPEPADRLAASSRRRSGGAAVVRVAVRGRSWTAPSRSAWPAPVETTSCGAS